MIKKANAWLLALFLAGGMVACNAPQGKQAEKESTTEEAPTQDAAKKEGTQEKAANNAGSEHPTGDSNATGGSEHPN